MIATSHVREKSIKKIEMIISYQRVKDAMIIPPPEDLVDLFNELVEKIQKHPECIQDSNPFDLLQPEKGFCLCATSIQKEYVALVLGKHGEANFPSNVMQLFFELDQSYSVQYKKIQGEDIDGCIFVLHYEDEDFDEDEIYRNIYAEELV